MKILGINKLVKLKAKNQGNVKLGNAIDKLVFDLENLDMRVSNLKDIRKDADCVHEDGFYFFDIDIHRAFVLIEFDEDGMATILWVGTHKAYELTFKNNKSTIARWLKTHKYI